MKPEKIVNGRMYEISVGKTPTGTVKKAVVKVLEKNLVTKTWLCETQDGKEMKVKDPARFLKELKTIEPPKVSGKPASPKNDEKTERKKVVAPEVSDELKAALKEKAVETQKKARIAAQAFEAGVGKITQKDVEDLAREAAAAKEKAIVAGVIFASKGGRSLGKMSGKDAAYQVLLEEGRPMNAREICDLAHERGYCDLTGATPDATIAAALVTDINRKGDMSRFKKTGPGLFAVNNNLAGKEK